MRILMVLDLPLVRTLGAARVQMELGEALSALGHEVDFLSALDVYPRGRGSELRVLLSSFARSAVPELRRRARTYDVIDALESCVTATKSALGFDGVLVARSMGLSAAYARWQRDAKRQWPELRGRPVGRLPRRLQLRYALAQARRSIRQADGVIVPNQAEHDELAAEVGPTRVCLLPFGLPDAQRVALAQAGRQRAVGTPWHVAFLGTWDARKGKFDLPAVIGHIRHRSPECRFTLLGTRVPAARVLTDLAIPPGAGVEVVPTFTPDELPDLLATVTAAVFPSRIEGFGFAVLEQLAAGIPVIAYDVPGPRDILAPLDPRFLVAPGDTASLAARVLDALAGRLASPAQCIAHAGHYRWAELAAATIAAYQRWAVTGPHGLT